jgi:glycosyltransferase involved in cell wall biosynthesis
MIESLACGTPVIAWKNGSVPEVLAHGGTGFVVDTLEEAVKAVPDVASLSRHACR